MAKKFSISLAKALRDCTLVRLKQDREQGRTRGYVLDVGPEYFLLAQVGDGNWLNGFECYRTSTVRELEADPHADFTEAALQKRKERFPRKPPIKLDSLEALLLSAGRISPVVTIHRHRVDPGACWIGRVEGVSGGLLSLLEITPDAMWDDTPTEYRLSEITRVDFGADYEESLVLVGGAAPARPKAVKQSPQSKTRRKTAPRAKKRG